MKQYKVSPVTQVITPVAVVVLLFCASCGKEPQGSYVGEISDWDSEVFDARSLRIEGQIYSLQLTLRQMGKERPAELIFRQRNTYKEKLRSGSWTMGDGKRIIAFSDGAAVQTYALYKQGSRFVFQDSWGLKDDNGSLILLMRNKGKSRKRAFPLAFSFEPDGSARFRSKAFPKGVVGEWELLNNRVTANFLDEVTGERQKYFMGWEDENLVIEQLTMYLPFYFKYHLRAPGQEQSTGPFLIEELREGVRAGRFSEKHLASHDKQVWIPIPKVKGYVEGTRQFKRNNWMYHTKFDNPPVLKPR